MNIGIDARSLTDKKAGTGTYVYEIIKQLNNIDTENNYFLYSNKKIVIDFELGRNWYKKEHLSKIGTYFIYFKLPKILKEDDIDVFWGTQHCIPKKSKYTKNIKFVVTILDLAIQKFKKIGSRYNEIIQKIILKKSCNNADKIIAISKSTKKDIEEILHISEEKVDVVYLGANTLREYKVNEENKKKIVKKYNLENKDFIFFLSTIEPRKNINTAIKAFEKYKEETGSNIKFIISGKIGWRCKDTLKLIKDSKYTDDIVLTGYISLDEKEFFFQNCKAFVYPSLYEGFGIPILEAMQRGALVITTNVSSLPEVGGDAAIYLQEPKNVKELKGILQRTIEMNEDERKEYIEKGYMQIKKFSWSKCAIEILNELVSI